MRLINCLIICLIALLIILPVAATHEIEVNEKRIEGCGDYSSWDKCVYIIGEQHSTATYGLEWEEYAVSAEDYDKINYGDKVVLEYNSATRLWVVK